MVRFVQTALELMGFDTTRMHRKPLRLLGKQQLWLYRHLMEVYTAATALDSDIKATIYAACVNIAQARYDKLRYDYHCEYLAREECSERADYHRPAQPFVSFVDYCQRANCILLCDDDIDYLFTISLSEEEYEALFAYVCGKLNRPGLPAVGSIYSPHLRNTIITFAA